MNRNSPFLTTATSLPLWLGIRGWMSTLRYRVAYHDTAADPVLQSGPPKMYLFWHENILMPLHLRGNCHCSMLLSRHRDADHLARIARRFGFDCVRGSTARGGARALRELVTRGRTQHLTITPDGPRGPRRVCSPGPLFLASKIGMPIVLMGMAYQRPWRVNSWDQFAIPKPFSRARAILSAPISVPPGLRKDELEKWRLDIQQQLNQLSNEAQQWADSGDRRPDEMPLRRLGAAPPTLAEASRKLAA